MSVKDWPWLAWLGLFLLVEVPAAIRKRGGTLSEWTWRVFALRPPERTWGPARRVTFVVFWIVTGAHFVVQIEWGWVVGAAVPFVAVIVYSVGWEHGMTREQWDAEWKACFERLRAKGSDILVAQKIAVNITTARYGPRPAGLSLRLRLALGFITSKLAGLRSVEVSPMFQRIIVAVTYGIGAASPVLAAAFQDSTITGAEWSGIATAFFIAFWGTFKSNTTIISPNRTVWTAEERVIETAKMDAGVLVEDAKIVAAEKIVDAKAAAQKR